MRANTQNAPRAIVNDRTSGSDVWYGAGALWNSISIPIERLIRPETVSAPWLTTWASITRSATPSRISASPVQEIGSTENPKSAVSNETAPSAPGSTMPGWKISKPRPAIPARKSRLMMFGSMSALSSRVKNPGLT